MRLLVFLLLMLPGLSFAQDTIAVTASVLDTLTPLKADQFIGVDSYNNLYYLKGRALFKAGKDQSIQFSDLRLGEISTVDILNPLKITAFYAETQTAVILDNTLNEITRVTFSELENFRNVSHARTARDGQLWIFNTDLQRLELFDYRTNRILSDFLPQPDNALDLASDFNTCWVLTETTLYQYNAYGSLISKQAIADFDSIALYDEQLFGLQNGKLFAKAKTQNSLLPVKNTPEAGFQFYYKGGILYLYRSAFISYYNLNLPK